jgi:hypothetical protein
MASDSNATPTVQDPEFDAPRAAVRRPDGAVLVPQETQRLFANPFLAVAILLFGLALLANGPVNRQPGGLVAALVMVLSSVGFLHYHCLDCGKTGLLFLWRHHECERVLFRRLTGRVRRWRGPTPVVQTILWFYGFLGLAILVALLLATID